MTTATDSLINRAWDALHGVIDPELGLDVVELGLIYDLAVDHAGWVRITMTLTTPGCPVSESLPEEVETAVAWALGPSTPLAVDIVWDPPWSPQRISEDAAERLGFRRRGN